MYRFRSSARPAPWILVANVMAAVLSAAHVPPAAAHSARLRGYSVADGLSQSSVHALVQDRRGFMWLATQDGLNRFDGYRFRVFRPDPGEPGSLSHHHLRALYEDASGTLWVGSFAGHLDRFDAEHEIFVPWPEVLPAPIEAILEDRTGTLWIGTYGAGVWRIDPQRRHLERVPFEEEETGNPRHQRVLTLAEDQAGVLWISTEGGLRRFDHQRGRITLSSMEAALETGGRWVSAMFQDRLGDLWLGAAEGWLYRFDPQDEGQRDGEPRGSLSVRCSPTEARPAPDHRVVAILEADTRTLWIATRHGGVYAFDRESETCAPLDFEDQLILAACLDRAGHLWMATSAAGVKIFEPGHKPFRHLRSDPRDPGSLSAPDVHSILEDHRGTLWIGTEGGGLDRRDPGARAFRHYLSEDTARTLFEDSRETLWIGTRQSGLYRFDRENDRFIRYRADPKDSRRLSSDSIRAIYEDRTERLWIGTAGGGLHRYNRGTDLFERFLVAPEDPDDPYRNTVTCLLETSGGVFWVGTLHGPLLFDPGRYRFRPPWPDPPDRLSDARIGAFHESGDGQVWIATQGEGLFMVDPESGQVSNYRSESASRDALPNNAVHGILEDESGYLWLSTSLGISRFDTTSKTFRNYGADDGLQSGELNAGAFYHGRGGVLYFGGVNGVTSFRGDEIRDDPYVAPIVITGVRLANEPLELDRASYETREIRLSHRDRVLSFEFAALSFEAPRSNRYAYFLENFDDDWIESGSRRYVTYTNLPAGEYVFRAKAANADGIWDEKGTSMRIIVAPAPWKSGWAYGLYTLAAVLAGLALNRAQRAKIIRERQALERERSAAERERQASERQHEADRLKDEYLKNMETLVEDRAIKLEERESLLREREELIRKLKARNNELAELNYAVSHDLRNPLVTIKNFLGLALHDAERGAAEKLDHDLHSIATAADQIEERLHGLVEIARIDRRDNLLAEVEMGEVVREAVDRLSGMIERRGVAVEIAPTLPSTVADRRRLALVFENLVENAVKFMGDQREPRIEIDGRATAQEIFCSVRDNGIGIDDRYHDRVFGLFDRLVSDTRDSGTGLTLVRRIVEAHGGRVWVESEGVGRGSTFCFTLERMTLAGAGQAPR